MTPEFIAGIGAISTLLLGLLTWWANRKRHKLEEEKSELGQVISVNKVLQEENERLLNRFEDTDRENEELKKRVEILEEEKEELKEGLAEAQKQILQLQHEIAVMQEYWRTK